MFQRAEREIEHLGFRVGTAAQTLEDNARYETMKADSVFARLEDTVEHHKLELPQHECDTFNDKFIFMLLLVVGTPCISSLLISASPALTYWVGQSGAVIGVACFIWMLAGHQLLSRGAVHRRHAVMQLLVVPIFALIVVNNFSKIESMNLHTQFAMQDCVTFPKKLHIENAWQQASTLLDSCLLEQAKITGSSVEELERLEGVHRCPGYAEGYKRWGKEWDYLKLLEFEEGCAGWCETSRPLWHAAPPETSRPLWHEPPRGLMGDRPLARKRPDRCSLVVGRSMKTKMYRTSKQIIFYCLISCAVMGLGLMSIEL